MSILMNECLGLNLEFALSGNTRGSEATYVARCRDSSRAYLAMTKWRCLGSLVAELPIYPRCAWSCPCQPWPLFFVRQYPSLRSPFLLGVASFPYPSVGSLFGYFISGIFVHLLGPMVSLWQLFPQKTCKIFLFFFVLHYLYFTKRAFFLVGGVWFDDYPSWTYNFGWFSALWASYAQHILHTGIMTSLCHFHGPNTHIIWFSMLCF